MSIVRMEVKQLMKAAVKRKQSARSFIWDMRQKGLGYRHTLMRADYRTARGIVEKTGLAQYVRKDRYPSSKSLIVFETTKTTPEYMYQVKVKSIIHPDVAIDKQYVNIFSDVPLTPAMVEQAVVEKWSEWEDYTAIALEEPVLLTAYKMVLV